MLRQQSFTVVFLISNIAEINAGRFHEPFPNFCPLLSPSTLLYRPSALARGAAASLPARLIVVLVQSSLDFIVGEERHVSRMRHCQEIPVP